MTTNLAAKLPKRAIVLGLVCVLAVVGIFLLAPIPQDSHYHQFADQRTLFGIPHFWNVVSNLPFIAVGIIGLRAIFRHQVDGMVYELRVIYLIFFIGLIVTGLGSSYYHWNPSNATLVWDRLPMTLSFMAFFSVIIGENISRVLARRVFFPLLLAGILSVVYWKISETNGAGDLRPYVLVQFLPILLIPLILWLYPSPFKGQGYIMMVLVAYFAAKLLEHFDHQIYELLGMMSGHPIKHVAAAIGTYFFYLAITRRQALTQ